MPPTADDSPAPKIDAAGADAEACADLHAPHPVATFFALFNEIGILHQLSTALLEARLPDGLLVSHFSVLNHLLRVGDGRTPLDLSRAFQVPKTTMTHTLAGLSGHGCVELRPNPSDRRSKQVWITDKGRRLRDDTVAALAPDIAALAGRFPTDRAAALLPDLIELRAILDAARDGPPVPADPARR